MSALAGARPIVWSQWLVTLVALQLLALGLYHDTAWGMVSIWARSDTFAHAFLVPPIVGWLIWRKRHQLASQAPQASAWVLVPMAAMAGLWLLGDLVAVNSVTQFAFTALLVLTAVALLGMPASRSILFPLGFLFFAVPIGEFLLPQLMAWTADFTVAALRISGIPVYRDGLQFVIPSGNWSVVEACSGVRYLIASLMVGTLFAYLNFRSMHRRLVFIAVSILVPILANWVRAYLIVLLGHVSDNRLAAGADHLIYGWVFFGIIMVIMFLIGGRWAATEPRSDAERAAVPHSTGRSPVGGDKLPAIAVALALLLALPHLLLWSIDRSENHAAPRLASLNVLAEGWQPSSEPVADWKPAFQHPSVETQAGYVSGGDTVGLYVGYYRQQDYRRKLVSSANSLVEADGPWALVERGAHDLQLAAEQVTMRTARLRGSRVPGGPAERHLVVWQVYWVNGRLTASDNWAKVHGALSRLLGRGDDGAVIIFYTSDDAQGRAEERLDAFARDHLVTLQTQLQATRADVRAVAGSRIPAMKGNIE